MLTDLCQELRNWFDRGQPKWYGEFTIENGALVLRDDVSLKVGQYYRIVGSALNDGVYQWGNENDGLAEESFTGAIWAMAVPPAVIALSDEIDAWALKYGDAANSPYQSESFGGYTYSKASGGSSSGAGGVCWQSIFKNKLDRWRKI